MDNTLVPPAPLSPADLPTAAVQAGGSTLKPKWKVELIEKDDKHFYYLPEFNETYGGVTGTLDIIGGSKTDALIGWAKKQVGLALEALLAPKINEEKRVIEDIDHATLLDIIKRAKARPRELLHKASDYGTLAHQYADAVIKGLPKPEVPHEMRHTIEAFETWLATTDIKVLGGDTKVASRKFKYGGSLDAWGLHKGRPAILDIKTSNGIRDTYALQVAAYWEAFAETFDIRCEKAFIVRFGKEKPDFEVKEVRSLSAAFFAFLSAKDLQASMKEPQFVEDVKPKKSKEKTK